MDKMKRRLKEEEKTLKTTENSNPKMILTSN